MKTSEFKEQLIKTALPVTVQSLTQASLSLIDQIMIGSLGSATIAGIGLAGKFSSLFFVTVSAIVTAAGILIAQYRGAKNSRGINDSFFFLFYCSSLLVIAFTLLSFFMPQKIMSLYADDYATISEAAIYLKWKSAEYVPAVVTLFLSTLLRNMDKSKLPAIAGIASIAANTILNWLLIFGTGIFPRMEAAGAALATAISRIIEMIIVAVLFVREKKAQELYLKPVIRFSKSFVKKAFKILIPILVGEFMWSLGENMYAVIYGHIGTEPCASMTLMYPIQGIAIGALCGVSSAAGIITGKALGAGDMEKAWKYAKNFVRLTTISGIAIGVLVSAISPLYVKFFNVAPETREGTIKILLAFSAVFTAKVFNMVIGGGVLQSGGQTKFITAVNIIGTWGFGVPAGFLAAYLLHLQIWWVYFFLSLEEYVRLLISVWLLRSKKWMRNVTLEPAK